MSEALEAAQRGTEILLGLGTTLVVVTGGFVTARVTWDFRATGRFNVDDCEVSEDDRVEEAQLLTYRFADLSVAAVILLAATHAIFYRFLQGGEFLPP